MLFKFFFFNKLIRKFLFFLSFFSKLLFNRFFLLLLFFNLFKLFSKDLIFLFFIRNCFQKILIFLLRQFVLIFILLFFFGFFFGKSLKLCCPHFPLCFLKFFYCSFRIKIMEFTPVWECTTTDFIMSTNFLSYCWRVFSRSYPILKLIKNF